MGRVKASSRLRTIADTTECPRVARAGIAVLRLHEHEGYGRLAGRGLEQVKIAVVVRPRPVVANASKGPGV